MELTELHASRTLAANVKNRRGELGWSMHALAEQSGLSEDAIEAIENGRRRRGVTVDELMQLAAALRVEPANLLPPLYDYLRDSAVRARHDKILSGLMTDLVASRQRYERLVDDLATSQAESAKLAGELEPARREVERLRGMLELMRQGKI